MYVYMYCCVFPKVSFFTAAEAACTMYVVVQLCPSVRVALLASRDITVVVVAERKKISRALGFDKMALLKEDFLISGLIYGPTPKHTQMTSHLNATNATKPLL